MMSREEEKRIEAIVKKVDRMNLPKGEWYKGRKYNIIRLNTDVYGIHLLSTGETYEADVFRHGNILEVWPEETHEGLEIIDDWKHFRRMN